MRRYFELISKEQFDKDFKDYNCNYDDLKLPIRKTTNSAGYDFYLPFDLELIPNVEVQIPTGIKANMYDDEMLCMYIRSGVGFKYNIRLCNQVGIIDSDYYNNQDNEGNIWIAIQNHGRDVYKFKKGDRIVQGIFQKYLISEVDNYENCLRKSGLGSTNEEEKNYE